MKYRYDIDEMLQYRKRRYTPIAHHSSGNSDEIRYPDFNRIFTFDIRILE